MSRRSYSLSGLGSALTQMLNEPATGSVTTDLTPFYGNFSNWDLFGPANANIAFNPPAPLVPQLDSTGNIPDTTPTNVVLSQTFPDLIGTTATQLSNAANNSVFGAWAGDVSTLPLLDNPNGGLSIFGILAIGVGVYFGLEIFKDVLGDIKL